MAKSLAQPGTVSFSVYAFETTDRPSLPGPAS